MTQPSSTPSSDYDTRDLWQKDHDHVLHSFAHLPTFDKEGSLVISRGEGAYVWDTDGKRYLDGIGGLWCVNIGYGNEEMAEALARQARELSFFTSFTDTTNPPHAELGAKLAALTPRRLNRAYLTGSGSAANDSAVRIIHHYFNRLGKPTKKKLLTRTHAYHGTTHITMSLGGKPEDRPGFDFNEEVVEHVSAPYPYRRPEGTTLEEFCDMLVEELEQKILELGPENVAGFFAEPIMGAGGVIVPPPGYHQRTQEVCRRYGVLTVSDEVVTGFGRLGHMFASEPMFGLDPDIIVCAKGISSGYIPLGGAIISDEIYEVLADPAVEGAFSHGYTYSGHPIACVAALKNIEIIERDDICGHVREVGPHLEEQLATLSDLPLVGDVRGSHFMMCVENVADKETKELLPESVNIGKRIADHCEERGVFVRPVDHLNVISPPLILTRDQIETIAGTLRESILATMDDLVREGLWKGR
jgi:adenosylmethionine-8-amino-7-oxononanoate aminotransferase